MLEHCRNAVLRYFTQDEMRKKVVRQYKKLVYDIVRDMQTGCADVSRRYSCVYQYVNVRESLRHKISFITSSFAKWKYVDCGLLNHLIVGHFNRWYHEYGWVICILSLFYKKLIIRWDRRTLRANCNYRLNHAMIVKLWSGLVWFILIPKGRRSEPATPTISILFCPVQIFATPILNFSITFTYFIGKWRLFWRIWTVLIIAPYTLLTCLLMSSIAVLWKTRANHVVRTKIFY